MLVTLSLGNQEAGRSPVERGEQGNGRMEESSRNGETAWQTVGDLKCFRPCMSTTNPHLSLRNSPGEGLRLTCCFSHSPP